MTRKSFCLRSAIVNSLCAAAFFPLLSAQESPQPPKKVLTPEQKAFQLQWKDWSAKHQALQAQAKQVFDAEMAREKAGDCPDAQTTYDFNICYDRQTRITEASLHSFEEIIRRLQIPGPEFPGQSSSPPLPSGASLTPDQLSAEFDNVERLWQQYRDAACTAAFHQFDGGTGGPSFQSECELNLMRDHMRELNMIYGEDLHL